MSKKNTKEKFVFFWKERSPFSQWHRCDFIINGIRFNCAEQYMMYQKAILFGDEQAAERILKANHPRKQKALGRQIRGYREDIWKANRETIVYDANYAKFIQNPDLKRTLLDTAGRTLVEASPVDRIWGIGLDKNHPDAKNREKWRGLNLLGEILTKLRDDLLQSKNRIKT